MRESPHLSPPPRPAPSFPPATGFCGTVGRAAALPRFPASARDYCFWWRRAGVARPRRRRRLCAGCPGSGAAAVGGGRGGPRRGEGRGETVTTRAEPPPPPRPASPSSSSSSSSYAAACATSPKSRPWVRGEERRVPSRGIAPHRPHPSAAPGCCPTGKQNTAGHGGFKHPGLRSRRSILKM